MSADHQAGTPTDLDNHLTPHPIGWTAATVCSAHGMVSCAAVAELTIRSQKAKEGYYEPWA